VTRITSADHGDTMLVQSIAIHLQNNDNGQENGWMKRFRSSEKDLFF